MILRHETNALAPVHLKSSMDLISPIQNRNAADNINHPYPFSLDVISFYTSIPIHEAIQNGVERMEYNIGRLTRDNVEQLFVVTLSNAYFTFEANVVIT